MQFADGGSRGYWTELIECVDSLELETSDRADWLGAGDKIKPVNRRGRGGETDQQSRQQDTSVSDVRLSTA